MSTTTRLQTLPIDRPPPPPPPPPHTHTHPHPATHLSRLLQPLKQGRLHQTPASQGRQKVHEAALADRVDEKDDDSDQAGEDQGESRARRKRHPREEEVALRSDTRGDENATDDQKRRRRRRRNWRRAPLGRRGRHWICLLLWVAKGGRGRVPGSLFEKDLGIEELTTRLDSRSACTRHRARTHPKPTATPHLARRVARLNEQRLSGKFTIFWGNVLL